MTGQDPAQHIAHDLPLVDRIISAEVRGWLETATALALAGAGNVNDYERGIRQGVEQMRHLHLSGWDHALVPHIVDALRRAGLLAEREPT